MRSEVQGDLLVLEIRLICFLYSAQAGTTLSGMYFPVAGWDVVLLNGGSASQFVDGVGRHNVCMCGGDPRIALVTGNLKWCTNVSQQKTIATNIVYSTA